MNPTLWITYLVLAGAAVVQALLLLLQTWENRRYSRSCMRDLARHRPSGRAVILAPCKGSEPALRQNLCALFQQDYPDYEITFIVQQANDPACAVIGRLMAEHPDVTARLLVAGRASQCGQKVHNLRAAHRRTWGRKFATWCSSIPTPGPGSSGSMRRSVSWSGRIWGPRPAIVGSCPPGLRWPITCSTASIAT